VEPRRPALRLVTTARLGGQREILVQREVALAGEQVGGKLDGAVERSGREIAESRAAVDRLEHHRQRLDLVRGDGGGGGAADRADQLVAILQAERSFFLQRERGAAVDAGVRDVERAGDATVELQ